MHLGQRGGREYDIYSSLSLSPSRISQNHQMEEELRQVERKLKQAVSEQDHLREHNTYLTSELDRWVQTDNSSSKDQ